MGSASVDEDEDGLDQVGGPVGQQRILRRIFQLLSWALARSPGPRWRAWAELTSFWLRERRRRCAGLGVGGAAPLRELESGAAVAVVGDHPHSRGGEGVDDAVLAGGAHVVAGAGQRG